MILKEGALLQGGKYKIIRHIASGGFGNTYEGYDVNLNKKVAIKEFFVKDFCTRDSDTTIVTVTVPAKQQLILHLKQKFIEEARAIANMEHENIVRVQTLFEENGTAYYVMDYIEGESLSDLIKRRGYLSEKEALPIILKVADALGYMHQKNCFHLDVKPANIMLRNDGRVILIDFGSSKQYAEVDGQDTTILGPCYSLGYAPSEQMNPIPTKFSAATDIYALGATFYKMLTGITPPSAIDLLNGAKTLSSLPESTSVSIRRAVENAMKPKMSRTQTIGDFIKSLNEDTIYGGDNNNTIYGGDNEVDTDGDEQEDNNLRSNPFWKILIGVVGAILLIIGAIYMHNSYIEYQQRQETLRMEMDLTRLHEERMRNQQNRHDTITIEGEPVYDVVEQQPGFNGNLNQWLASNLKYPSDAIDNGIEGRVIVQFIVGRDGHIHNAQVARGVDPSLDKEALRVVNLMPEWVPGKRNGQPVNCKFTLPIVFRFQ